MTKYNEYEYPMNIMKELYPNHTDELNEKEKEIFDKELPKYYLEENYNVFLSRFKDKLTYREIREKYNYHPTTTSKIIKSSLLLVKILLEDLYINPVECITIAAKRYGLKSSICSSMEYKSKETISDNFIKLIENKCKSINMNTDMMNIFMEHYKNNTPYDKLLDGCIPVSKLIKFSNLRNKFVEIIESIEPQCKKDMQSKSGIIRDIIDENINTDNLLVLKNNRVENIITTEEKEKTTDELKNDEIDTDNDSIIDTIDNGDSMISEYIDKNNNDVENKDADISNNACDEDEKNKWDRFNDYRHAFRDIYRINSYNECVCHMQIRCAIVERLFKSKENVICKLNKNDNRILEHIMFLFIFSPNFKSNRKLKIKIAKNAEFLNIKRVELLDALIHFENIGFINIVGKARTEPLKKKSKSVTIKFKKDTFVWKLRTH